MIKKIFTFSLISILSFSVVSARTVEYDFYSTNYIFKNYQQFGKIETDNEVVYKDVNYVLDTNFTGDITIPKYTSLEKKIIDRFGYEKINKIVNSSYIRIGGSKYRFPKPLVKGAPPKDRFDDIKLEEKEILNTNLNHNRVIRINSKKDQSIKLRLYSVSPDTYNVNIGDISELTYPGNSLLPDKDTVITLYDTTQEFYNVSGRIRSNMVSLGDWNNVSEEYKLKIDENSDLKIEKKYELIKFKRKIPNGEYWISKSYIPYHEISFDVSKGVNDLYLNYESYQSPNEPLQIK